MNTSVIHVKVRSQTAQSLKLLSKKRAVPVGELVRQAVSRCYQFETMELAERQRLALAAYQGGYISIGKLSEEMGMTVLEIRHWLEEHDLQQNGAFSESDIKNA
ncbi:MAG: hypothetical protein JXA71_10800 [Chitinispirillaceae bacterium]|nr:hypothetical protein [Chitinispirillaceae bacterium]